MKFTKMSLVAALLIGSSAFAIENTKITGDANVYYHTQDKAASALKTSDGGFFEAANSAADIGVNLNVTTDLLKNDSIAISAGAGYTVLATLGLENNLVGNVWGGAHSATANTGASYGSAPQLGGLDPKGAKVNNANWVNEAWVAATAGKSTVKVGRMELDTPLAFTEKWSIEKNTFEAAVLINQDIPDTTLVAAFVGNGNGTETFGQDSRGLVSNATTVSGGALTSANLAVGPVVNQDGEFTTYGTNGAYAIGAINNSWKPLTVQAWYYDVTRVATAYWLQGDLDLSSVGVDGLTMGGQYTGMNADVANVKENTSMAAMIGYAMKDTFSAKLAYSHTSASGTLTNNAFNTATAMGTAQSKLYTEAWWNYGQVTKSGAKAINLTVEAPTAVADLGLYVTMVDQNGNDTDLTEATLTASRSIGALDATVAYIYTDAQKNNSAANNDSNGNARATNAIQAYLTLNF